MSVMAAPNVKSATALTPMLVVTALRPANTKNGSTGITAPITGTDSGADAGEYGSYQPPGCFVGGAQARGLGVIAD